MVGKDEKDVVFKYTIQSDLCVNTVESGPVWVCKENATGICKKNVVKFDYAWQA